MADDAMSEQAIVAREKDDVSLVDIAKFFARDYEDILGKNAWQHAAAKDSDACGSGKLQHFRN
jgi:hypothetical protein